MTIGYIYRNSRLSWREYCADCLQSAKDQAVFFLILKFMVLKHVFLELPPLLLELAGRAFERIRAACSFLGGDGQ